jgi:drug/metabolite transporter (DMT)-like permease
LGITTFDNAFFWSRVGFVALALSLLLVPEYLEKIRSQVKSTDSKSGILVIVNKILAGIGSILVLKATELGDAAVVQALGGLQFVFLLIIGVLFMHKRSKEFGEKVTGKEILHKAVSIALITLGFFVLFV